ncbi:MAG: MFS transporter [Bacteroidales bacterium]|nr:MFS transporter [Bacteroidales bacterium]
MIGTKKINTYYPWMVVGILWVVSLLNYLDRLLIASMRDPIKESIPMSDAQFGLLTSVFLVVYGILSPLGGYFADRYSRKLVIVISLLVWSCVTMWTGFVRSFPEMLTARAIMGMSEACYIPAAVALIIDYHKGPTRSLASGILMSGLYAGMALGGAGGYIAEIWGWRFGFQLFGCIGIVYSLILIFFLKDAPKVQSESGQMKDTATHNTDTSKIPVSELLRNLFSSFSYRIILVYGSLLGMTFWVIYAWLPTYFKEGFNLSLGEAGISATAFIQAASFIGVITGGIIADRWSRKNRKGRVYIMAIGFILGGPFLFLMSSTQIFGIAIASIVIFGLAKGFHDANFMPVICQVVDQRYRATGYGIMSFFSVIAGGIMIYLGGALKDTGISLSVVFQISAAGVLLSGLILLLIRPKAES